MANTVDKVLALAESEVGYIEKASNDNLDNKTANKGWNNYTKYGRDMHRIYPQVMDFPAPWCDAFVDWCFYKAYGIATAKSLLGGNFDDYTVASAQMYKNKGAWYVAPKVGDQIFFKNTKGICHTGIVYKVVPPYVYTIEGNTSSGEFNAEGGCVAKKQYLMTDTKIAGFGRPKYDIVEDSKTNTKKSNEEIAKEVIAGLWGTGETRINRLKNAGYDYATIQKIVNNLLTVPTKKVNKPVVASGTPVLKKGSKGQQVIYLQADLNYVLNSGLVVDGDFGPKTKDALLQFQSTYSLYRDGEYGPKSEAKMNAKINK